jgi:hypothetical protein
MYSSSKPKPKIDPMNLNFDFMIKNYPELFTKLSSRDNLAESARRLPPASGGYSGLTDFRQSLRRAGGGRQLGRVGGAGATLQPKKYPPTLMRNPKPKRGRNNFFK